MDIWKHCLKHLGNELTAQQLSTWIRPLHPVREQDHLKLLAPNAFVLDWVRQHYLERLNELVAAAPNGDRINVLLDIGCAPLRGEASHRVMPHTGSGVDELPEVIVDSAPSSVTSSATNSSNPITNINRSFTFNSFVEGKSNQLARAAGMQIGSSPGRMYNPFFIYGGVGLGKTHLMHAIGNLISDANVDAKVVYMHSEGFVANMVKALQHGTINEFKRRMRSLNALLIDDVQFFGGKERSQEEFFHTFNALFESEQQIILTSDRFPKEVEGLEDRLKSRFGWGLTVAIEPPDLETRVAILKSKAVQLFSVELPNDVAFFIGKRVRSNIRELEGALRRIIANSEFTEQAITLDFAKEALRDMIAAQDKQITIANIQKTVAEYYTIRVADLLSPKRSRMIARPRQIAMSLARELTSHSLPEIGEAFGGRDHTTVLYATTKIGGLRESDARVGEDYNNLLRTLSY